MIHTIKSDVLNSNLRENPATNNMANVEMSIRDQVRKILRNMVIDRRINQLSQFNDAVPDWANLSDEEKEKHIRGIISLRHAIDRMKKLKR